MCFVLIPLLQTSLFCYWSKTVLLISYLPFVVKDLNGDVVLICMMFFWNLYLGRVDYQSKRSVSGASSFNALLAVLPPRVNSVYYRDDIGNISTSHLRTGFRKVWLDCPLFVICGHLGSDICSLSNSSKALIYNSMLLKGVYLKKRWSDLFTLSLWILIKQIWCLQSELEFEPRYPLFGGWRATFIIGYRVPLEDYLFEASDGRRYLNFTFGCPLVETIVNKLTIKVGLAFSTNIYFFLLLVDYTWHRKISFQVVLPEGSKDPSAVLPFTVNQDLQVPHQPRRLHWQTIVITQHVSIMVSSQVKYSYLDIVGRTVVVLQKDNVVPTHNVPFQVKILPWNLQLAFQQIKIYHHDEPNSFFW